MTIVPRVRISKFAREQIAALPPEPKRRVRAALRLLTISPESGKELKRRLTGCRSLAIPHYRIIYRVEGSSVDILMVGSRDTIYARLTDALAGHVAERRLRWRRAGRTR